MIDRIKSAWLALRGTPAAVPAEHYLVVLTDANGMPGAIHWNGLVAEDAAMALYRAADLVAEKLPQRSFKVH